MKVKDYLIRGIRLGYRKLSGKSFLAPECDCDRQSANDRIFNLLSSGKPCMISRFGTVEINCINNYLCVQRGKDDYYAAINNFITDKTHTPWWFEDHFKTMAACAGIFPPSKITSEKFSQLSLEAIPQIDILGCHQYYEKFMPLRDDVQKVQLEMLYPFFVERPWTRALKGKRVLVVHPFTETIRKQYEKRKELFDNPDVLPDYTLLTLKAEQTIGGVSRFDSWFDALDHMKQEISKIDFDICILGCGAYGMPLAAYVKSIGKQAIHIGGGTQLLFGIKGKRWVEQYHDIWHYRPGTDININYRPLFNDSWVFAGEEERPAAADNVEGGCYW